VTSARCTWTGPAGQACILRLGHASSGHSYELSDQSDSVNHPNHYNSHPAGIECIDVVEHLPFNVGNAIKYLWRAGLKGDEVEDLRKAAWYVYREIERLTR